MFAKLSQSAIALAVLLTLPLLSAGASEPARRPNLLVIMADDLGYGDVSYMGHAKDIETPHIDSLAAKGLRFNEFYANCPVCSPTRAALLSGRYQEMVGVPGVIRTHAENNWGYLNPKATMLPELLQKAGYHTAIVGKWHLGLEAPNIPNKRGFDFFHGFLGDMMDDYYTHQRHGNDYMYRNETLIKPKGHATDLFTDWACDYVRDRKQNADDKPWFLYLAYNAPHTPIQPPKDWLEKVRKRHTKEWKDPVAVSFEKLDPLNKGVKYEYRRDDVEQIRKQLGEVDGARVRIRGFMYPTYDVTGVRKFLLAKELRLTNFVGPMGITELIPVSMRPGTTTNYIQNTQFNLEGILHIDPVFEDGECVQLYRIDNARIVPDGPSPIDERRAKLVALIEHMDDGIGKVLEALDESGQTDNTIIVFTSDNGGQINVGANNGPLRDGKQSVYEGGLKVPTCMVWPGTVQPNIETNFRAMSMDILPTLMDITGVERPQEIEGRSFKPMLLGNKQQALRDLWFFARREGGNRYQGKTIEAVRQWNWKLLQNSPFEPLELYDIAKDPMERNNLAKKNGKKFNELSAALRKQQQRYGSVPWQKP